MSSEFSALFTGLPTSLLFPLHSSLHMIKSDHFIPLLKTFMTPRIKAKTLHMPSPSTIFPLPVTTVWVWAATHLLHAGMMQCHMLSSLRAVRVLAPALHVTSFAMLCACMLSCFRHVWLCATLWTVACQAPLSMGFCFISKVFPGSPS